MFGPPKILMLKSYTDVMALGGRAFGRCLGHKPIIHGALMNGTGALVKETPEFPRPSTLQEV